MMVDTIVGTPISATLMENYFHNLVNRFFKILPMRENNEESLITYMQSLQAELLGCEAFIPEMKENSLYLSLLSILQYLINTPECSIKEVKREVFGAISVCNKLMSIYTNMEES